MGAVVVTVTARLPSDAEISASSPKKSPFSRLVRAGHREHLRDARVEDVHERDFEPGAAEAHDARRADRRVDAALAHQREEGVREVLAVVRLLVDVLLQHGKVAEREEDAAARDGELDLGGQLGHSMEPLNRR